MHPVSATSFRQTSRGKKERGNSGALNYFRTHLFSDYDALPLPPRYHLVPSTPMTGNVSHHANINPPFFQATTFAHNTPPSHARRIPSFPIVIRRFLNSPPVAFLKAFLLTPNAKLPLRSQPQSVAQSRLPAAHHSHIRRGNSLRSAPGPPREGPFRLSPSQSSAFPLS